MRARDIPRRSGPSTCTWTANSVSLRSDLTFASVAQMSKPSPVEEGRFGQNIHERADDKLKGEKQSGRLEGQFTQIKSTALG